ncbi:putative DNA-binding protein [Sulfolobus polyhedral virus 1]|uniref:Helix-turn-helix domain n=2 Tax=Alphaportoglobovirus TaxID=2169647 RepID=A0A3Q8Q467_9VIRU|nr:putative DNA-binding protein [Sulfolobus polyhedral virus 1]YP_010084271.1 helix-turn-helix domain [Sulfolobus polyhedral virus 2]ARM37804.1 putative DNA-binding protein [Sulfolobus polyhedral virus 1]AZI76020.1 helix-turn-helix domain [Sulfolobus polyhedral virus 2]
MAEEEPFDMNISELYRYFAVKIACNRIDSVEALYDYLVKGEKISVIEQKYGISRSTIRHYYHYLKLKDPNRRHLIKILKTIIANKERLSKLAIMKVENNKYSRCIIDNSLYDNNVANSHVQYYHTKYVIAIAIMLVRLGGQNGEQNK